MAKHRSVSIYNDNDITNTPSICCSKCKNYMTLTDLLKEPVLCVLSNIDPCVLCKLCLPDGFLVTISNSLQNETFDEYICAYANSADITNMPKCNTVYLTGQYFDDQNKITDYVHYTVDVKKHQILIKNIK